MKVDRHSTSVVYNRLASFTASQPLWVQLTLVDITTAPAVVYPSLVYCETGFGSDPSDCSLSWLTQCIGQTSSGQIPHLPDLSGSSVLEFLVSGYKKANEV